MVAAFKGGGLAVGGKGEAKCGAEAGTWVLRSKGLKVRHAQGY